MFLLFVSILLAIQGIPLNARDTGTVSGVLRNVEGKPAAKVRVAALARPEGMDSPVGSALASIAETDENGRYRLESIPPGQYYIVAGRIQVPTFYPGASKMTDGAVVRVAPGAVLAGMDFILNEDSVRNPLLDMPGMRIPTGLIRVPLKILTDGGKTPVLSANGPLVVHVDLVNGGGARVASNAAFAQIELPNGITSVDCRIRVAGLPEGYTVKSVTQGVRDLTNHSFTLAATMDTNGVMTDGYVVVGSQRTPIVPIEPVTITIFAPTATGRAGDSGVRVTGVGRLSDSHPVYLSGSPGTVFSDGTFEFRSVMPGRHVIALIDSPGRARGATVIVGTMDVENVELDDVTALPLDIQTPAKPEPTAGNSAGAKLPLAAIHGRVVEESTGEPAPGGLVFISGMRGPSFPLDPDGKFTISDLLPGTYLLEIKIAMHSAIAREVVVRSDDVTLELNSKKTN
jgi:hypothetical protein